MDKYTKTEKVINYAMALGVFVGNMEYWKKAMTQQEKNVCARFFNDLEYDWKAAEKLETKLWAIRQRVERINK